MSARAEIIRSNAAQPWTARIVRNRTTWRTENYARKVGAERALVSLAETLGWNAPYVDGGFLNETPTRMIDFRPQQLKIEYIDART